jgi:hypothetical protein
MYKYIFFLVLCGYFTNTTCLESFEQYMDESISKHSCMIEAKGPIKEYIDNHFDRAITLISDQNYQDGCIELKKCSDEYKAYLDRFRMICQLYIRESSARFQDVDNRIEYIQALIPSLKKITEHSDFSDIFYKIFIQVYMRTRSFMRESDYVVEKR